MESHEPLRLGLFNFQQPHGQHFSPSIEHGHRKQSPAARPRPPVVRCLTTNVFALRQTAREQSACKTTTPFFRAIRAPIECGFFVDLVSDFALS